MRKIIYVLAVLLIVAAISTPFIFAAGDFSITASPTSGTVAPGGSASTTVTASPTGGFSGPVTLSASISPSSNEISTSFSKNPVQPYTSYGYAYPDSSTLTVTTNSNAAPGTYTITVTGTSGSLSHSTSVTLQVQASGTTSSTTSTTTTTTLPSSAPTIVLISAPPTSAAPGDKLTFSWEITGTGSISHTAVHWGTSPGANPKDIASYPEFTQAFASINPPDQAPKTYTASFNAPTQPGTVYYIVHAIVDNVNIYMSAGEQKITIQAATTAPPTTAPATTASPTTGPTTTAGPSAQAINPVLIGGAVAVVVIIGAVALVLRRR